MEASVAAFWKRVVAAAVEEGVEAALAVFAGEGSKHRKVGPDFEFWYGLSTEDFSSWWLTRFYGRVYGLSVTGGLAKDSLAVPFPSARDPITAGGRLWVGKLKGS
jgi:hypothetical protein